MKIVFFDIDGTLANGLEVPESAAWAVRQLRQNGNLVFICTGRTPYYVERYFGRYADGFICLNGRLALMGEQVIYDHPVEYSRIRELSQIMAGCGASAIWYGRDEGWFSGSAEEYELLRDDEEVRLVHPRISENMVAHSFNIYYPDQTVRVRAEKALEGKCLINPHGPLPHGDGTVLGHDKGSALTAVRRALKVRRQDTYGFGDGVNDLSMLENVGHGIAMANGVPQLRERAEYVTTAIDEDGVLNGLRHYGLI